MLVMKFRLIWFIFLILTCFLNLFVRSKLPLEPDFFIQWFTRGRYSLTPGLTFFDSLWLEWFPDANTASHALQADTCDFAAPQCLHLGSLEFQSAQRPVLQPEFVCLAAYSALGDKIAQLIIQAENSGFLLFYCS